MNKFIFSILFITTLIIFLISSAVAGRYVVSSTSNSTNWSAASWTNYPSPFNGIACTPATAMANAVAGDIVYFRGGQGGHYDITGCHWTIPALYPINSGTADNPIIFRNYPGETPILRNIGNDATWGHCLYFIIGSYGKNYIIWDGFKLGVSGNINTEGNPGILLHTGTGLVVKNMDIIWPAVTTDDGGNPKNYTPIAITACTDCLVQNVRVVGGGGGQSNAINVYGSTNLIVEKSSFYNHGIYLKDNCINTIIRLNFFSGITSPTANIIGLGAGLGNPWQSPQIYQNVVIKSSGNFIRHDIGQKDGGTELIYNNTIYHCGGYGDIALRALGLNYGGAHHVFNNVIVQNGAAGQRMYVSTGNSPGQPTYMDYNIYYGLAQSDNWSVRYYGSNPAHYHTLAQWKTSGELVGGGNPDINSYEIDPIFTNPGGDNPEDYKISAIQKNRGRGGNWPSVIGAYITGNEQIGYVDPFRSKPQPSPPSGLRIF